MKKSHVYLFLFVIVLFNCSSNTTEAYNKRYYIIGDENGNPLDTIITEFLDCNGKVKKTITKHNEYILIVDMDSFGHVLKITYKYPQYDSIIHYEYFYESKIPSIFYAFYGNDTLDYGNIVYYENVKVVTTEILDLTNGRTTATTYYSEGKPNRYVFIEETEKDTLMEAFYYYDSDNKIKIRTIVDQFVSEDSLVYAIEGNLDYVYRKSYFLDFPDDILVEKITVVNENNCLH